MHFAELKKGFGARRIPVRLASFARLSSS